MTLDYIFVGFSVTEQRVGYFPRLKQKLEDQGKTVGLLSMGARPLPILRSSLKPCH